MFILFLALAIHFATRRRVAVVGGRYVSTKIYVKQGTFYRPGFCLITLTVTYGGSILFLLFGIIYLYEAFATSADAMPVPLSSENVPHETKVGCRKNLA